jgi:precorrin isomerase
MAKLKPGSLVILRNAPSSLLHGLPEEDQAAIHAIVGHPVIFAGYSWGQAKLEFTDSQGDGHTIWVETDLIRPA